MGSISAVETAGRLSVSQEWSTTDFADKKCLKDDEAQQGDSIVRGPSASSSIARKGLELQRTP